MMATTIRFHLPTGDESRPMIQTQIEHPSMLHPSTNTLKPLPSAMVQSIETHHRSRLPTSHSTSDVLNVKQSFIDKNASDGRARKNSSEHSKLTSRTRRSPSEVRVTLFPEEEMNVYENLTHSQLEMSTSQFNNELRSSDPVLLERKTSREKRADYLRRTLLDHRFGRRIHSSFSSSTTLRSLSRRRSTQNLLARQAATRHRRPATALPRDSKWHVVRRRLHDIAMMSESYARMRTVERDLRWINLREKIRAQVQDMREMSLMRQQDDGVVAKNKSFKTKFDLKTIPMDEMLHVERDGRVFSMSTRDLVLGRLLSDEDLQLDPFAQLDARRQFQVQQKLLRQQEGRTRLKKHIAFSFCLCNLSFIVLMSAAMFIFAMKTILELRSLAF